MYFEIKSLSIEKNKRKSPSLRHVAKILSLNALKSSDRQPENVFMFGPCGIGLLHLYFNPFSTVPPHTAKPYPLDIH